MAPTKALQGAAFHDSSNTGPRASHNIPDGGTFSIYSSTTIAAPPEAVYDAILDVSAWQHWNSFVYDVTITKHPHSHQKTLRMTEGTNMTFHVKMTESEKTTSKETCTHVEHLKTRANHSPPAITRIRWSMDNANLMAPGFLIKAERTNEIEEADDGTTLYRTWQTFGGLFAKTVRKKYEAALRARFVDWCRDLKTFVEAKHAGSEETKAPGGEASSPAAG